MILGFAENKCILKVLKILSVGTSKYTFMFRKTGASHTTLHRAIDERLKSFRGLPEQLLTFSLLF